jgi:ABC-2 type transport system ATP-binding protein
MAQEKAVEVTSTATSRRPVASCFEKIELTGDADPRITYRKDRVNAGEVLGALQREGSASSTSRPARRIWRTCS